MYVRNAISGGYENGAVVDDIEVLDVKSWTMDATVADVVVDEKRAPRIVLAGDAMHASPPTGGHLEHHSVKRAGLEQMPLHGGAGVASDLLVSGIAD